jgi:chorismate dehydratase
MTRLGRIGYINCYPVYKAVDRGIVELDADLVTGTPTELNNLLAAGALDVSVVSAVEYARNAKDYHLLPDLAISCDGPVRSVCLFSHCAVQDLDGETVLVSASSRTSVHLLELLCHEQWNVRPAFVEARAEGEDLDALAGLPHKAVLVIGDAALLLSARRSYQHRYDLGEEWKRWTGLPFVFAVWASRRSVDPKAAGDVHASLVASRDWGLANIEALAVEASRTTNIELAVCRTYLSGLDYALSYRHLEGLTSFFRRLTARGAVRDGTLSFLSVA